MATTLLTTGLACLIAAIIGGGLKAFGIEIPALASRPRQVTLGALGFVLTGSGLWLGRPPAARHSELTRGTWTLVKAIDDSGTDWGNSTLKFTAQQKAGDGFRLAGFFEWRSSNVLIGREDVEGHYDPAQSEIILEGKHITQADGFRQGTLGLGSYSAHLSPDGLALTDGRWGTVSGVVDANVRARWEATR